MIKKDYQVSCVIRHPSLSLVFGELTQPRTHLSYHPCTVCRKHDMIGCVMDEAHFPVGHFQLWRGRQQTFREWGLISLLAPRVQATHDATVALQKHTYKRKRRPKTCATWSYMPMGHRKGMEGLRVPVQIEYNRPKRLVIGCVRWRPNGRFCEMRISRNQTQSLLGISESLSIQRLGWLLD